MASPSQDYTTPRWLFRLLSTDFGAFETDAWASTENALCPYYCDGELRDGFDWKNWRGNVFGNPPFNRSGEAVKAAYEYHEAMRRSVVLVLQAGISPKWFHQYAIKGRVLLPDLRINYGFSKAAFEALQQRYLIAGKRPPKKPSFNRDSFIIVFSERVPTIEAYPIRARRKDYEERSHQKIVVAA